MDVKASRGTGHTYRISSDGFLELALHPFSFLPHSLVVHSYLSLRLVETVHGRVQPLFHVYSFHLWVGQTSKIIRVFCICEKAWSFTL